MAYSFGINILSIEYLPPPEILRAIIRPSAFTRKFYTTDIDIYFAEPVKPNEAIYILH